MAGDNTERVPDAAGGGKGLSAIRLVSLVVTAAAAFAYLATLSALYNGDGVVFSFWVEEALGGGGLGKLWHPRHLAYNFVGYCFSLLLTKAGVSARAIHMLQLLDAALAAATVALFMGFCRRVGIGAIAAAGAGLAMAFSFGFWYSAVEPEVYALNTFAWMLSLYLARAFSEPGHRLYWPARSLLLGLAGAFLLASHVVSGLMLLPLGWASLWWLRDDGEGPPGFAASFVRGLAPASIMSAVALGGAAALYIFAHGQNPLARGQELVPWIAGAYNPATGLGYKSSYWSFGAGALLDWAGGFADLFAIGGERLIRPSPALAAVKTLGLIFVGGLLVLYAVRLPRLFRADKRTHALVLLGLVPLALFSLFWEPGNFEIKTALLPAIFIAAASGASSLAGSLSGRKRLAPPAAIFLCAALLFGHNLAGVFAPGGDPANNADLAKALFIGEQTEPDAAIYLSGLRGYWKGKFNIPYFGRRQARVVDWIQSRSTAPFPGAVVQSLERDRGRPIYILGELLEPGPASAAFARAHGLEESEVVAFFRSLNHEPAARMPDGFTLYRLYVR